MERFFFTVESGQESILTRDRSIGEWCTVHVTYYMFQTLLNRNTFLIKTQPQLTTPYYYCNTMHIQHYLIYNNYP